ncbi:membrane protein [Vibrio galatheae]|uniref:Membrane protein n=1 Tax=Vibrio galatheae TaxID=579748 RepID=A0A0F4NL14_9VIBR|nr:porin [Vibrio galatheae]KJY82716.1 membrane protein [Vibrio galatheae]
MKKAVLASAVFAAMVSGSSLAATVYKADGTEFKVGGRVEFRGDFIGNEDGEEVAGTMDDASRARFNLKGKSEITEGMSAFGVYEGEQKINSSDNGFKNRYMYAGLDFDGHALSFGKQDMAAVIVSDMTDISEFSGVQQVISGSKDKRDSVIAYRGEFADSFQLQATYQAQSDEDKDGYSLAGLYSAPFGLDVGLAFSGNDEGQGKGSASQVLGGLGYTWENLYIGGTYSAGDLDDKATGTDDKKFTAYELAFTYKITKPLSIALVYTNQENEEADGFKYDDVDGVEFALYYKFNANFRMYGSYFSNGVEKQIDATTGLATQGEDTLRFGARYDF